jgi:hypothetical protein
MENHEEVASMRRKTKRGNSNRAESKFGLPDLRARQIGCVGQPAVPRITTELSALHRRLRPLVLLRAPVVLQQDRRYPLSDSSRRSVAGARNHQRQAGCGAPTRLRGSGYRTVESGTCSWHSPCERIEETTVRTTASMRASWPSCCASIPSARSITERTACAR